MNSVAEHFGEGIDITSFDVDKIVSQGRCCIGVKKTAPSRKWFGLITNQGIKIDPDQLSFCEYCAKYVVGFSNSIFEVTDQHIINNLQCDSYNDNLCKKYNLDLRYTQYRGIMINVNITDSSGYHFTPALKANCDKSKLASKNGIHPVLLPDKCFPEIIIKADPNGQYGNDHVFKVVKGIFDDGTEIKISQGRTNESIVIRMNPSSRLTINSIIGGKDNTRLFYSTSTDKEIRYGIQPAHHGKTDKITFDIEIYKEFYNEYITTAYRGAMRGSSGEVMRGGSGEVMRGGSGEVMRGGSGEVMRGGSGEVMRGGSSHSYNKGATFMSQGISEKHNLNDYNNEISLVDKFQMIVQFVNNEDQKTIEDQCLKIESQVAAQRDKDIIELERKLEILKSETPRSKLFNQRDFIL